MEVRVLVLAAVSLPLLTRPAVAQKAGTIELGVFGRFTDYDNSLVFTNKVGFGGRAGIFLPAPANRGPNTSFNGNLGMQLGVSILYSFLK
ncbi:MAG TPA: hypothetical protein VIV10_08275 [Gemmatimonadales bacterium]